MKVLIVGGTGYLGSQLHQFLKKKHKCFVPKRIRGEYKLPNLPKFFEKSQIIIILSGQSFKQINKKNISYRKKILEKLINKNIKDKLIIYYSTTAKFSKNVFKNYYVKSHRLAEDYLIQKLNKKNFKIIRLDNVFGLVYPPRKKNISSSPINSFINDIIDKKSINLKTPNASRRWILLSRFLKLNEELILKKKLSKLKTKKMTISEFVKKLYILQKIQKLPKNLFDQEIVKTFSILRKN